jgi:hypothetical protein
MVDDDDDDDENFGETLLTNEDPLLLIGMSVVFLLDPTTALPIGGRGTVGTNALVVVVERVPKAAAPARTARTAGRCRCKIIIVCFYFKKVASVVLFILRESKLRICIPARIIFAFGKFMMMILVANMNHLSDESKNNRKPNSSRCRCRCVLDDDDDGAIPKKFKWKRQHLSN